MTTTLECARLFSESRICWIIIETETRLAEISRSGKLARVFSLKRDNSSKRTASLAMDARMEPASFHTDTAH